jgi:hypothetical protein
MKFGDSEISLPVYLLLANPADLGRAGYAYDGVVIVEPLPGQRWLPVFSSASFAERYLRAMTGTETAAAHVLRIVQIVDEQTAKRLFDELGRRESIASVFLDHNHEQAAMARFVDHRPSLSEESRRSLAECDRSITWEIDGFAFRLPLWIVLLSSQQQQPGSEEQFNGAITIKSEDGSIYVPLYTNESLLENCVDGFKSSGSSPARHMPRPLASIPQMIQVLGYLRDAIRFDGFAFDYYRDARDGNFWHRKVVSADVMFAWLMNPRLANDEEL